MTYPLCRPCQTKTQILPVVARQIIKPFSNAWYVDPICEAVVGKSMAVPPLGGLTVPGTRITWIIGKLERRLLGAEARGCSLPFEKFLAEHEA